MDTLTQVIIEKGTNFSFALEIPKSIAYSTRWPCVEHKSLTVQYNIDTWILDAIDDFEYKLKKLAG